MSEYAQLLIESGLMEFGLFYPDGKETPIRFNWEYLPAFPDLLKKLSDTVQPILIDVRPDRLLVPWDVLPLGLALSLQTNVSLIYDSTDGGLTPNVVGAYDSGHTALMVSYEMSNTKLLLSRAGQVGLKVIAGFSLLDYGVPQSNDAISWHSGMELSEVIRELTRAGQLSMGQGKAIHNWIAQQKTITIPHPDSAAP